MQRTPATNARHKPTNLLNLLTLASLTCFLPATVSADTFSHQVDFRLSDNNSYSVSVSPSYRYYFNPVDDTKGPLDMAGFLNQASSVYSHFDQTDYPSGATFTNDYSWVFYGDFVFTNGFDLGLGIDEGWSNYDPSSNWLVLESTISTVDLGYYWDPLTHLNLGFNHMSSSVNQAMDSITLSGTRLLALSDGRHLKVGGSYTSNNHIRSYWDSDRITISTTYYPQHDLGLSTGITHTRYDEQNNKLTYSFGTKYYLNTRAYIDLATNFTMQGSENWSNRQTLKAGARF
jgi:hypothetical protein